MEEFLNPTIYSTEGLQNSFGSFDDPFGFNGYRYSTSWQNRKNARNAATAEAAYNAKTNYAYWVANNLYNSPAAQMLRYQEAGLNPNMIYDKQNNVVAGSAPNAHGSVPTSSVGSPLELALQGVSSLVGVLSSLNGLKLQSAQIQKAQADADLSSMRTWDSFYSALGRRSNYWIKDIINKFPSDWDDMTLAQRQNWVLDNFKFETFPNAQFKNWPYGDTNFLGLSIPPINSDYTDAPGVINEDSRGLPQVLVDLINNGTVLDEKADSAEGLFKSLINLRKSSKSLNDEKVEQLKKYLKDMFPKELVIKGAESDFVRLNKDLGVIGDIINIINQLFQ